MNAPKIPNLGLHILVVMDNCESGIDMLEYMTQKLPDIHKRHFTLIHCIPPVFWEHGGNGSPRECERMWQLTNREFRRTDRYFRRACDVLRAAGVPAEQIDIVTAVDAHDTRSAVLRELRQSGLYTGVILSHLHSDLAALLTGRSMFSLFLRYRPRVTVWEIGEIERKHMAAAR
ncbi:MAG: hypothetical protein ACOCYT_00775 [Chloroflexota bacterium]